MGFGLFYFIQFCPINAWRVYWRTEHISQFSVTTNIISFYWWKLSCSICTYSAWIFQWIFYCCCCCCCFCHRLQAPFSQHSMFSAQYENMKMWKNLNEKSSGAAQKSEQFYFFSECYLIVVAVAWLGIRTTIVEHFCAHSLGACVHAVIWRCALFASYKVECYYLIKIQLPTNNNNVQHFKHSLPWAVGACVSNDKFYRQQIWIGVANPLWRHIGSEDAFKISICVFCRIGVRELFTAFTRKIAFCACDLRLAEKKQNCQAEKCETKKREYPAYWQSMEIHSFFGKITFRSVRRTFFCHLVSCGSPRNWTTRESSHPTSDCFTISLSFFSFSPLI